MARARRSRRLLLGLTGVAIDGGIACVNRCIARALAERLARADLERVDSVLLYGDPDPDSSTGGRELRADGSRVRFLWQLWRSALRLRPDLIFFDHAGLARVMTLPLPGLLGRPYVVFVHGAELSVAGKGQRAAALLGADRILVNSEFTRDLVRGAYGEACPPIHVVTLCIEPARIARWEADLRPPPTEREPAVLIVGRMLAEERGKGHDELLEAWPKILASVPRARLWIVGGGNDVDRLRRKTAQLELGDAVSFEGRISDDELRDRYLRASLFAMPSCQEGFGIVYAEAMWHELPCLGSHADAARTVIEDGETGLLVPYGDVDAIASAISGLLSDPVRARKMGETGARLARSKFSFERFRTELLEALLTPATE